MKFIITGFIILGCLILKPAYSQFNVERNTNFINLSLGFHGPGYHSGWRPSFNAGFDRGIVKNTTIGVNTGFYRYNITEAQTFTSYTIGVRGSYYFTSLITKKKNKKMNYYAGLGLSYYRFDYSGVGKDNQFYVPGHIGVRRLWGKRYGAFAELGINEYSAFKAGLTTKF